MRRGLRGVCRPADSSPRPPGPRLGTEVAPLRGCPGSRSLLPAKALCTLLGPPSPNLPEAPQAPASGHVAGLPPPWDVPPSLLLLEMRRGQGKPPPPQLNRARETRSPTLSHALKARGRPSQGQPSCMGPADVTGRAQGNATQSAGFSGPRGASAPFAASKPLEGHGLPFVASSRHCFCSRSQRLKVLVIHSTPRNHHITILLCLLPIEFP